MRLAKKCPFCRSQRIDAGQCLDCGTSLPKDALSKKPYQFQGKRQRLPQDEDANGGWSHVPKSFDDRQE